MRALALGISISRGLEGLSAHFRGSARTTELPVPRPLDGLTTTPCADRRLACADCVRFSANLADAWRAQAGHPGGHGGAVVFEFGSFDFGAVALKPSA